jgi:hypothetical protein
MTSAAMNWEVLEPPIVERAEEAQGHVLVAGTDDVRLWFSLPIGRSTIRANSH